jgi:hypothetical protein
MAINNFIPEVWSASVQTAFAANQVIIPTLTTSFAGEATRGNTVHIIGAVTPTIVDYKDEGRVITAEALADTNLDLLINNEKAFAVKVDDIDVVQAASNFDAWVSAAGRALAEDAESAVIAELVDNGTEISGAAAPTTGAAARKEVLKLRTAMSTAKVPANGRYLAVSPAYAELLLEGLSDVAAAGSDAELRNGVIGRLAGFTVVESPLMTGTGAIAYHEAMVAFVGQLDKIEAVRSANSFADVVRGLNVYGVKVVNAAAVQFVSY